MMETYNFLKAACKSYWYDFGSLRRFKDDVREAEAMANEVYELRLRPYAGYCHVSSNNRGRLLELRAYAHLALGILQLAPALTEEPRKLK